MIKKKKDRQGYILLNIPDHPQAKKGWVQEHRVVVEKFIGRYLNPEEVVHHLDFDKENNKIDNLMIFPNQKAHMKFHTKLAQFGLTNPIKRQIANRWDAYLNKIQKGGKNGNKSREF